VVASTLVPTLSVLLHQRLVDLQDSVDHPWALAVSYSYIPRSLSDTSGCIIGPGPGFPPFPPAGFSGPSGPGGMQAAHPGMGLPPPLGMRGT
jgi:hypothetical protein